MSDGKPRPYQVAITARADRDVPEKIAAACVEFLFGPLAGNPHRLGKPLREISPDCTRARRGGYRVIYAINGPDHCIEIVHIDRRSHVYR